VIIDLVSPVNATSTAYYSYCIHSTATNGSPFNFSVIDTDTFLNGFFESTTTPSFGGRYCSSGTASKFNNGIIEGLTYRVGYGFGWGGENGSLSFQSGDFFILETEPIILTSKITSFTYSTTTELAHIEGFWKATTTPGITERLTFWQDSSLGQEDYEQVYATTTGFFSYDFPFRGSSYTTTGTTTAPLLSEFTINARLDQYGPIVSFTQTDILPLDATSTAISGLNYGVNDYSTSTANLLLYPEYECGITSMTGCIKNAFIWAFYPTQNSLSQYDNFLALMQNKAPFGYFYSVKGSLSNISSSSTPVFSITIPGSLRQYIFGPFDVAVASILWFFGAIHIYKRLKDIQI